MAGHGEKYTRNQERAVAALLACPSIQDAAKVAGIGERTLRRWMAHDEFKAAYNQARRNLVALAIGQIQGQLGLAVNTLCEVAGDGAAPASARVAAARAIIEQSLRAVELEDLKTRVEMLEQTIKERPR